MMQDAVLRNFAIVGEAVKKLPATLKAQYSTIPWKEIAGMRDILIHDYSQTNLHIVWQTIRHDLPPLLKTVEKMIEEND